MGIIKTSNQMINGVKRRASLPTDSATFSDQDYLDIINEEFMLGLLATVMIVHEEYYVYPHTETVSSGQTEFIIPARAVGNKLRQAKLVSSSGNNIDLARIKPEDANKHTYNNRVFYLQGNKLIFVNTPSGGSVQMDIFLRPNQLVLTNRGATVQSIDTTTGIITFTENVPSHFATSLEYDFISKTVPCKTKAFDITASDKTSTTLTFDPDDIPSNLVAGDYVTIAQETIVPQLPVELIPIVEQMGAIYCLDSIGDFEASARAEKRLEKMQKNSTSLIDNRTEGNTQKIVNTSSLLRLGKYNTNRGS